jgi:hypothetical protein
MPETAVATAQPDDEVVVQVSDLKRMEEGLNAAYWWSISEDMVTAYRTLDVDGKRSKSAITVQLEDALQACQATLKLAEKPDGDSEETPAAE